MDRLAVVLVSDQTIPNVVYLKNVKNEWDRVLFVTTESMESKNKAQAILKAIGDVPFGKIVVDENRLFDITKKLIDYFDKNKFDEVIVNITGGTKLMSLGVYNFFKDNKLVKNIVYLPINSNLYKQIFPMPSDGKAKDIPITYRMSVKEYMDSSGVEATYGEPLDEELSKFLLEKYFGNEKMFYEMNERLRKYRKDKKAIKEVKSVHDIKMVKMILGAFGVENIDRFNFNQGRKWIDYFSGGWFEEYIYSQLKILKDNCIDDVEINIKTKRSVADEDVPNEFDVMFTKDNRLFVVECKSGDLEDGIMMNALYKVAYLNKEFGLSAKSYFATLDRNLYDNNGNVKTGIRTRSRLYNIDIIDRNTIKSGIVEHMKEKICK